jgi:cysteine desulfurase/selenocysteine lyase
MEHHSDLVPWQLAAQRTGATLKHIPVLDDGTLDQEAFEKLLTPQVKLLALVHISNSLGTINPVREMCAKAKAVGASTFVDAAQSAGHIPISVQDIGCDFLAFSGHKMCAPTGIGALYGRRALLDTLAPDETGGGMVVTVDYTGARWKPAPERFEAGTPDIAGAIGLAAACDYLDGIGRPAIAAHDHRLGELARAALDELPGIRVLGPRAGSPRAGMVSFAFANIHAHDVITFADQQGVALRGGHHCNMPLMKKLGLPSTARASFYLYNTEEEVAALAVTLRKVVKFFG